MSKLVRVDLLDPSPFAERYADAWETDLEYLNRLTADIKRRGIQSPLHVYPRGERFEVVAGHNRLQAARRLGLVEVPVDLRMLTDDAEREEYFIKDNPHRIPRPAALARAVVLGHPDWTLDRVAEFAGVGHSTVQTVRAELIEAGQLSETGKVKGTDGKKYPSTYKPRAAKTNGKEKPSSDKAPSGRTRSKLNGKLGGETPEQIARRGIEFERETGPNMAQAAKAVGLGVESYSNLKKIVLLADDPGLNAIDAGRVRVALEAVNTGAGISAAYESVNDIATAKFGGRAAGGMLGIEHAGTVRLASLQRAISSICAACAALDAVDVPAGIPGDDHAEWIADLDSAQRSVRDFIARVKEA